MSPSGVVIKLWRRWSDLFDFRPDKGATARSSSCRISNVRPTLCTTTAMLVSHAHVPVDPDSKSLGSGSLKDVRHGK
ncbi:hypothetical protein AK812_SmicGene45854 [Symbiodinium microadriaticum]|uniref:Uncharacterized protein n=1 Tax=Symbiodinium microadriaticum TaxID=2951 RepID=A0A1Q9BV82_SYMMI|nr:hypothetical protein AK812_SmicGene45854 [Symbiodinium microadriaticum]